MFTSLCEKKEFSILNVKQSINTSTFYLMGARCSSLVECLFMVWWVVGSIPHGGPIDLFLMATSVPRLV